MRSLAVATLALFAGTAHAQATFGTSCAGASGVTPQLSVIGVVQSGQPWTLTVTAPGGSGLCYLLVGFSSSNASLLGGAPLPLDLGAFFARAEWNGCWLSVDPSYLVLPYTFDPNGIEGNWTKNFPGFDTGSVFIQAFNVDADFTASIAGVSRGLQVIGSADLRPGLVPVPAGTFAMGSDASSDQPYYSEDNERPVHPVTISQPMWAGRFEVTQSEYSAIMGTNPSSVVNLALPVESVTWSEASTFCATITANESALGRVPTGYEYRLPTEAEWEYLCRAGTTTEYSVGTGNSIACADAAIRRTLHGNMDCGTTSATPPGGYAPNPWGLFDTHGNVAEWCYDALAPYSQEAVVDPLLDGDTTDPRVVRGGSWGNVSNDARSAHRGQADPSGRFNNVGFRVVLAPILTP